jgi:hypothetical protein
MMASNFRARRYRYDFVAATVKLMKNGLAPSSEQKKNYFFITMSNEMQHSKQHFVFSPCMFRPYRSLSSMTL